MHLRILWGKEVKKRYLLIVMMVAILTSSIGIAVLYKEPVNILLYGLEGSRTDTMMLVMVNPGEDTTHVISIPRDTYYPTAGRDKLGQSKLNATYGFKKGGGTEGLEKAVSDLTGVSIDYFVAVDYKGVASVVDLIGGVEVDVPFKMVYDDPTATPPLHINFEPGIQTISGDHAIEFLRFRKSNDGKIREGDVQRIARQQQFINEAVAKTMSWRLPMVVTRALAYVDTDLNLLDAAKLGIGMAGMTRDDLFFHTIPAAKTGRGKDGLSYYFHDPKKTATLVLAIQDGTYVKPEEK